MGKAVGGLKVLMNKRLGNTTLNYRKISESAHLPKLRINLRISTEKGFRVRSNKRQDVLCTFM